MECLASQQREVYVRQEVGVRELGEEELLARQRSSRSFPLLFLPDAQVRTLRERLGAALSPSTESARTIAAAHRHSAKLRCAAIREGTNAKRQARRKLVSLQVRPYL